MPAQMKNEKPILFSGEMVRAILDGRKTQTRRILSNPKIDLMRDVMPDVPNYPHANKGRHYAQMNPLGAVSCLVANQKSLGLKPGEFDFVCPYCCGDTRLIEGKWHIAPDHESRLWVKETFCKVDSSIWFRATDPDQGSFHNDDRSNWTPSIFMPRKLSRLTLEIVSVHVERLQDISVADAIAEGMVRSKEHPALWTCGVQSSTNPVYLYELLWELINGDGSWAKNPWVWVIEFRRVAP